MTITTRQQVRVRVNEMIRAKQVRVVDDELGNLGVMTPEEGIVQARARELDLVEVAPEANPPVCRIMNYGKFQYQKSKRAHEAKKHQKQVIIKEVKFRPRTDDHDYEFKKNHILRFLSEGNKAKASVVFRGREMTHQELGQRLLARLVDEIKDLVEIERPPKMEGYALVAILAPKKK
ncbi:MAG: bacterial translation initiation factor 3 (bIF-3) [Acidobacteria bacterium]|jgi:translation initiation factor IF-3|nr:bacterial translation initiation factor 3 (bIF-3) [Acidobacteriota bacterium]